MRALGPSSSIPSVRSEIRPGLWLDSRRALWIEAERLLVVADLHWGYVASHRARGHLLPVWGDDDIAQRLNALVTDYRPAEMLWLGDIVHAAEGGGRAEAFLRDASVPITALAGNHDRRWRGAGAPVATRGGYFFHHGDREHLVPEGALAIIGHHHPSVTWDDGAGSRVKLPVLVAASHRLVLPAFSPWAAGATWISAAGSDETLWAVTPARIFALPRARIASSLVLTQ